MPAGSGIFWAAQPPEHPSMGDLWFDSTKGCTYIWGTDRNWHLFGRESKDRQCPVWLLPHGAAIPFAERVRCVLHGPHAQHSDRYLIEEQCLD